METWTIDPHAFDGIVEHSGRFDRLPKQSGLSSSEIEAREKTCRKWRILFYPASGPDWPTFLKNFWNCADEFIFCDLFYNLSEISAVSLGPHWLDEEERTIGLKTFSVLESGLIGKPYLEPNFGGIRGVHVETEFSHQGSEGEYSEQIPDPASRPNIPQIEAGISGNWGIGYVEPGELVQIVTSNEFKGVRIVRFRRGFGQAALARLNNGLVSVFVHRNDGIGEGGSNLWLLSDSHSRSQVDINHKSSMNLFSQLLSKLANPCLIISDGSNTDDIILNKFFGDYECSGRQALSFHEGKAYRIGGRRWQCVGFGGRGRGPTLVWRVSK